jgi:hypothetical protein
MKHIHSVVIAVSLLVGSVSTVTAQDYGKAYEAYFAGDYQTALTEWRPLAEQGNAAAQTWLGDIYQNGRGVPQDYAEAVKWYRLSAEQGNSTAQTNLGVLYEFGYGVLQSNVMAYMWYNIASANGADVSREWRDERAGLMTNADISKAQEMARECMNSNYQNCGG